METKLQSGSIIDVQINKGTPKLLIKMLSFKRNKISEFWPFVFIYFDKDGKALYIGTGINLLKRETVGIAKTDKTIKKQSSYVGLISTKTLEEAIAIRLLLIEYYKPKYNNPEELNKPIRSKINIAIYDTELFDSYVHTNYWHNNFRYYSNNRKYLPSDGVRIFSLNTKLRCLGEIKLQPDWKTFRDVERTFYSDPFFQLLLNQKDTTLFLVGKTVLRFSDKMLVPASLDEQNYFDHTDFTKTRLAVLTVKSNETSKKIRLSSPFSADLNPQLEKFNSAQLTIDNKLIGNISRTDGNIIYSN